MFRWFGLTGPGAKARQTQRRQAKALRRIRDAQIFARRMHL